jgi:hypothetical protein
MTTTKITVRYISGRVEQYEVELYGGASAEARLEAFSKDPTIVLQTEKEVVIIPATAIECITFPLPESGGTTTNLRNVRKGKRLK